MFEGIEYTTLQFVANVEFNGIEYDSRKIKEGNIFIAMKGTNVDANDYISFAINNGAKTVITDKIDLDISSYPNTNFYYVKNLRYRLGEIASNLYKHPQNRIKILAVTGTNGKTTSTYILENVLKNSSRIGTTNYRILDKIYEAVNTTPESLDLIKLIDESVRKNVEYFIMEVSSHALSMGRCDMLEFSGAIFTNLTQDHLDYHKTMEEYFLAKARIVDLLKKDAKLSINIDDKTVKRLDGDKTISFGIRNGNIIGRIIETGNEYMYAVVEYDNREYKLKTRLIGEHNLYNILGVISMLTNLGIDIEKIIESIEEIKAVPGRFELIKNNLDAKIVVDYAHTPDGLDNVLKTLRKITKKRVITLFGAGGNRDKTKRSKMANKASLYSDYIILTSDNPREEDPYQILKDIELGLIQSNFKDYEIIENRKEAIKKAISMLNKDDSLMIAGKGHEDYQIIGKVKTHFSDKEEVLKCLS
ncbi:UDP-N-acetylmuramoyl-L-alanyl-D-glutamate--2,6-diaminopimelate ligase [Oceanivirga miroungae]|uniref:UDP-N-acetylmuramoyl-L-alanyl-D-glutamate--2,6-diaminopimelate ligase n=1 Tax=Oceanivirga miroungae TaxID=1130046 RepID=A0A6I8M808_9FUSO|nr:UDP-N-acetylmuramoyl-L-alanyl-D-glutamate--2,6-diaminopimelate ligase [Oceanivirga miroungae]VWL85559.1 UDP-N-acetylmuramyl tripeptide synthetase [Oceanivirga miroungae]